MKALRGAAAASARESAARRNCYIANRVAGLRPVDAARESGVSLSSSVIYRHEAWYKAFARGEHFLADAPSGPGGA